MTRLTKTKVKVEEILSKSLIPLGLKELHLKIKSELPKTSYSTVFRNVQTLLKLNKVNNVDWRERGSRYEWAAKKHHHHLVCDNCGGVVDLSDKIINFDEKMLSRKTGFAIKTHKVEILGVCKDCQETN